MPLNRLPTSHITPTTWILFSFRKILIAADGTLADGVLSRGGIVVEISINAILISWETKGYIFRSIWYTFKPFCISADERYISTESVGGCYITLLLLENVYIARISLGKIRNIRPLSVTTYTLVVSIILSRIMGYWCFNM